MAVLRSEPTAGVCVYLCWSEGRYVCCCVVVVVVLLLLLLLLLRLLLLLCCCCYCDPAVVCALTLTMAINTAKTNNDNRYPHDHHDYHHHSCHNNRKMNAFATFSFVILLLRAMMSISDEVVSNSQAVVALNDAQTALLACWMGVVVVLLVWYIWRRCRRSLLLRRRFKLLR